VRERRREIRFIYLNRYVLTLIKSFINGHSTVVNMPGLGNKERIAGRRWVALVMVSDE